MDISEGYRWNVPVVTYGFDQSFLDYFGSNGVAAVEGAIQILNDLPAASAMVLTNYPTDSRRVNWDAQAQSLFDLRSTTLVWLVEQLGLTQPTRNLFMLRRWDPTAFDLRWSASGWSSTFPDWNNLVPYYVVERNFDPETLLSSRWINGTLYNAYLVCRLDYTFPTFYGGSAIRFDLQCRSRFRTELG